MTARLGSNLDVLEDTSIAGVDYQHPICGIRSALA
jgi:hypothetical protein